MNRRDALKALCAACGTAAIVATPVPILASDKQKKKTVSAPKVKRKIFYFSATGNSLFVSREIAGEGAELLSIPQEIHNETPVYEAEEIGFVFPTYCFTAPAIVQDFIDRSTFKAEYFFAVATFGAHTTRLPEIFGAFMKDHGITMNYISSVQMVDTYLPFFDQEREMATDKHTDEMIAKVKASINARENYILPVTEFDNSFYESYYRSSGRDKVKPALTIYTRKTVVQDAESAFQFVLMAHGSLLMARA